MSFTVFTDSVSNLPGALLKQLDIHVLPCNYMVEDQVVSYNGDIDHFNSKAYYDVLRDGKKVSTSLINVQVFAELFRPQVEQGKDVLYVGMSGSISGTYQAARIAADELSEEFPDRIICTVDSMGAGFGTGLLACEAADLRNEGKTIQETAAILEEKRMHLCEYFTVGSLEYLRRSGRISAAIAAIGTVLNIKPLLYGNDEGLIVSCAKCRGRKKAIEAIAEKYRTKVVDAQHSRVAITHADSPEDAEALAEKIRQIAEPKELYICPHEPFTGSHVGPETLALFFFGDCR